MREYIFWGVFFQACTGRKKKREKKEVSNSFFMPSQQVWLHQGKKKKKKKSCINYTESTEITTITIIITLKN